MRELCENGLLVVWGVMLLPFISRLMLLKGLGGEGYRGYLDNWAYVWGMWLAFAYLGVWWLGYVIEATGRMGQWGERCRKCCGLC